MEKKEISGLIFKAKEGFRIEVAGVKLQIETIYCRTRWGRSLDGKKIEIQCNIYLNKESFQEEIDNPLLQESENTISVRVINEKNEIAKINGVDNYGLHELPQNYDNNDLKFTHEFMVNLFEPFLELKSI